MVHSTRGMAKRSERDEAATVQLYEEAMGFVAAHDYALDGRQARGGRVRGAECRRRLVRPRVCCRVARGGRQVLLERDCVWLRRMGRASKPEAVCDHAVRDRQTQSVNASDSSRCPRGVARPSGRSVP